MGGGVEGGANGGDGDGGVRGGNGGGGAHSDESPAKSRLPPVQLPPVDEIVYVASMNPSCGLKKSCTPLLA